MVKTCANCSADFKITGDDLLFYEKVSPVFNGRKYLISEPKNCPACREQRRWAVRNQSKLYKRKCDFTGKPMISLYSPDKPFKVYSEDVWWSDKYDPLQFGRDFDFSRPFFEQFNELLLTAPRRGMHQDGTNENSKYTTFGFNNKNCYYSFASFYCQNTYYSTICGMLNDSSDCFFSFNSELLYECVDCSNCFNCSFCSNSARCADSVFLDDCRDCSNCIFCKNLRKKQFHIFNKPVSKEEFNNFKKKLWRRPALESARFFEEWKMQFPHIALHMINCEDCTGNHIENAKNCRDCFNILLGGQDLKYCQWCGYQSKDLMDCSMCGESELLYEMQATAQAHMCAFTNFCRNSHDVYYCDCVSESNYCFGCTGLKHKSYCILNKQYKKEEYEELVPRIIEHMKQTGEYGEFFPTAISPFGYNETVAHEYFPLSKDEAQKRGYKWKD